MALTAYLYQWEKCYTSPGLFQMIFLTLYLHKNPKMMFKNL